MERFLISKTKEKGIETPNILEDKFVACEEKLVVSKEEDKYLEEERGSQIKKEKSLIDSPIASKDVEVQEKKFPTSPIKPPSPSVSGNSTISQSTR